MLQTLGVLLASMRCGIQESAVITPTLALKIAIYILNSFIDSGLLWRINAMNNKFSHGFCFIFVAAACSCSLGAYAQPVRLDDPIYNPSIFFARVN